MNNGRVLLFTIAACAMMLLSGFVLTPELPSDNGNKEILEQDQPSPAAPPLTGGIFPKELTGDDNAVWRPIPQTMGTRGKWNEMLNTSFEGADWAMGWDAKDQNLLSGSDYWYRDLTNPRTGLYSLNCSAGPVGTGGNGVGYDNDMQAWDIYGPFNLSTALAATLTFWVNMSVEKNSAGWDSFWFGVNVGAVDGNTFWCTVLTGNRSWTQYTVDLSKYDGISKSAIGKQSVNFTFIFESNGSICGDVGFHGAFVDDVILMNKTNVAPNPPVNLGVVAPTVRRVTDQEPTLKWDFTDPDGTKWEAQSRYHIQVSDDDDFSDIATDKLWDHNETTSTYGQLKYCKYNRTGTAKGMYDGQTYYFRVRSRDADDAWGPWSDVFNFTHNDNPSPPTVLTPTGSGLKYTGGDKVNITWVVSKNDLDYIPIDTISINISYGPSASGPWTSIVSSTANNGTYNPWTVPSTVEYPTAYLRVTGYDGYEETHAYFGPFVIDNFAPVINSINVTSDKPNIYTQSMSATGGTVWFNSLAGMGSGQKISVIVNWTDATKTQMTSTAAFDGAKTISTPPYSTMVYTVSVTDNANLTMDITVSDYEARTDTAQIKFNVDNTPPNAPVSVDCSADVLGDKLPYDDDQQFFVSWVNGTDSLSGLGICKVGLTNPPTIPTHNNSANFTTPSKNVTVFAYVQMMDNVGNLGAVGKDNISIDFGNPLAPQVFSLTHPDPARYYSNNDPTFYWLPPTDLSGVAGYGYKYDGIADTIPASASLGTQNFTSVDDVADGVWYIHVKALDNVAYWGNTTHFKFGVDTTAPTITNLTPSKAYTGGKLDLRFKASDVLSGVDTTSAVLYWKFSQEAQYRAQAMPYDGNFSVLVDIPYNSTDGVEYYFTVNDSAITPNTVRYPATGHVLVNVLDQIPPKITNATGNVSTGTGGKIDIIATVTDNVQVQEVRLQVVGKPPEVMNQVAGNYHCEITAPTDSISDIVYSIWATDTSGKTSTLGNYRIQISDTIPPIIEYVTGNTTGTPGKPVTILVSAYDNIDGPDNITPILHVLDAVGEAEYEFTYMDMVWSMDVNLKPTQKEDLLYFITLTDKASNSAREPSVNGTQYHIFLPRFTSPVKDGIYAKAVDINWSSASLAGYDILVTLYSRGASSATWTTLDTNLENTGHYSWNVSMFDNGEYYVKIKVVYISIEHQLTSEIESPRFYIYNPHYPIVTFQSPKRGTYYDDLAITWTATDKDPGESLSVGVYFRSNQDANWTEMASGLSGSDTKVTWDTTGIKDGTYIIKVVARDSSVFGLTSSAQQDGIVVNNTLHLDVTAKDVSPVKDKAEFSWKVYIYDDAKVYNPSSDVSEEIIISYAPLGGSFTELTRVQNGTGSYTWDVSALKDGKYQIKFQYVAENGKTAEKVLDVEVKNGGGGGGTSDLSSMWWIFVLIAVLLLVIIIVVVIVLMRRKKKDEEEEPKKEPASLDAPSGPAGPDVPDMSIAPVPETSPPITEDLYTGIMPVPDSSPYSAIAQEPGAPGDLTAPAIPPISQEPPMLPPATDMPQQPAKAQAPQPGKAQTPQTAKPTTPDDKRKTFDDIFSGI